MSEARSQRGRQHFRRYARLKTNNNPLYRRSVGRGCIETNQEEPEAMDCKAMVVIEIVISSIGLVHTMQNWQHIYRRKWKV